MSLFEKLKILFFVPNEPKEHLLGVLPDSRPQEEKANDPVFSELVAKAADVTWEKKEVFRTFGSQDQSTSSSCVAQSVRKAMRVLFNVNHNLDIDPSATDIYRRRSNFPDEGMSGPNAFTIASTGVQLNALMPSDNLPEYKMNNPTILPGTEVVASAFKIPEAVTLPIGDIDVVASVIERTGKAVVLFYYFTREEWSKYRPTVDSIRYLSEPGILRHAVAAVDYTLDADGTKCLVIDDSAHFGSLDRRLISEEMHKARNFYAAYPMRFSFDPKDTDKPSFIPGDIVSLQNCLKAEGFFPTNVESTGFYGPVTTRAVKAFQAKYGMEQVGTVGPKTTAKLQELYP